MGLQNFVTQSLKLKNNSEWFNFCRSKKKPLDIPSHPRTVDKNKGWINNQMDREEAKNFLNNLKNDTVVKNKRKFMSATYIGRIMSLGYSIKDIFHLMDNQTFIETLKEVNLRTNVKKEEYYKRLMAI